MQTIFIRFFIWLVDKAYFRKIVLIPYVANPCDILSTRAIPLEKNRSYLALLSHRNGALDGWVYAKFLHRFVFMMARQLHRIWWLRVIFPGIAITRAKDNPTHYIHSNLSALKDCMKVLVGNTETKQPQVLCVFPEGSSALLHKHLPFEQGAAWLAKMTLKSNTPPLIMPMSIFYDNPSAMGGRAFVVYTKAFELPTHADIDTLHTLFSTQLEHILLEYETPQNQQIAHFIAALLSGLDSNDTSYYTILRHIKHIEIHNQATFATLQQNVINYQHSPYANKIKNYKKAPIYPKNTLRSLGIVSICMPLVCFSFILNSMPLLCGYLAGLLGAKEEHTISLWRIIIGYGVGFLWWGAIILSSLISTIYFCDISLTFGILILDITTLMISLLGLRIYGVLKQHSIALFNRICFPRGRKIYWRLVHNLKEILA